MITMCTAVAFKTKDFYFGRTLDYDFSYGEEITITPSGYSLPFRHCKNLDNHYAIIGMAHVLDGYPLYYDAVNEKGLGMAGLNFVGYAKYSKAASGFDNIAHFELIPWLLGQCASVQEAKTLLTHTKITDTPFQEDLPISSLHWLLSDSCESVTIESTEKGLTVWDNPVGILTNSPEFDDQLFALNDYMHLSAEPAKNRFSERLSLTEYSRGMGAIGLPGDFSSRSRFVRAAFIKENSVCGTEEFESVSQFFHILGAVEQTMGCCKLADSNLEHTIYTSCCNATKGIYYYTTYWNQRINAVSLQGVDAHGKELYRYPLNTSQDILFQN